MCRLSPFGMADNPGFREVCHHVYGRAEPRQDPLALFQRIRLTSLTFLFYGLKSGFPLPEFYGPDHTPSQPEFLHWASPFLLGHEVNTMDWKSVAGLEVMLCNL